MIRFRHIIVSVFLIVVTSSCSHTGGDPFESVGFNPFDAKLNKRVEAYHQISFPNPANQKTGNPGVYIDFSNGIIQAYTSNTNNKLLIEWITQKLSSDNSVKWFQLAAGEITPIESTHKEIYNIVVDPKSYSTAIMAPIEKAIQQITSLNNDALLITDFEEYESQGPNSGKEQFQDFAKQPFEAWLAKGNSITFFISPYTERTKDGRSVGKFLYYIVFTCGNKTSTSLLTQIEYAFKGRNVAPRRFDLTPTPYIISNRYDGQKTGGIFYDVTSKDEKKKNLLDFKREEYVNGLQKNNPFEFYRFGIDWNTINEIRTEYQKQNQFSDFFRKLFVDLSDEDVYTLKTFKVKVYDVTEDFAQFAKCKEVSEHKPKIEKGSNGEDKINEKDNDDVAISCYDNRGKIKPDWVYKAPVGWPELKEVFTLNNNLFANTRTRDKSNVELAIQFHPKFNIANISNPSGLLRVDILIDDAEPNLTNPQLDLFKWQSTTDKTRPNQALYESIRNTIGSQQIKPNEKVIYSYYIKAL